MNILDFYFDFSSSYSYIAAAGIDELAAEYGWQVRWQPIALGAIFQQCGHQLPERGTAKQRYIWHDVERSARLAGLPYHWPEPFPFNSIPLARAFVWLSLTDGSRAHELAKALFQTLYADASDVRDSDVLLGSVAEKLGLNAADLQAGSQDSSVKASLREATELAMRKGVFGAPTFVVEQEIFWGADRMGQLRQHLENVRS